MTSVHKQIYQFKVFFQEIEPLIWRRLQISATSTFWELSVAIQDMLGWQNTGMHEFIVQNVKTKTIERVAIFDEGWDEMPVVFTWKTKITDYFNEKRFMGYYNYPLGAEWFLRIEFEKSLPRDTAKTYPLCLDGAGKAPPEPSATFKEKRPSIFGRFRSDPQHRRYQAIVKELGNAFDLTAFDKDVIQFSDPKPQLKRFGVRT